MRALFRVKCEWQLALKGQVLMSASRLERPGKPVNEWHFSSFYSIWCFSFLLLFSISTLHLTVGSLRQEFFFFLFFFLVVSKPSNSIICFLGCRGVQHSGSFYWLLPPENGWWGLQLTRRKLLYKYWWESRRFFLFLFVIFFFSSSSGSLDRFPFWLPPLTILYHTRLEGWRRERERFLFSFPKVTIVLFVIAPMAACRHVRGLSWCFLLLNLSLPTLPVWFSLFQDTKSLLLLLLLLFLILSLSLSLSLSSLHATG